MDFVSTRQQTPPTGFDTALAAGLAPDGGLFVPQTVPTLPPLHPTGSLAETATAVLAPFVAGSALAGSLPALCRHAFSFDAPLRALHGDHDHLLELFHGPTAAFKDYAARFLAGALAKLRCDAGVDTTVVVATSGDTGAAVASAFHDRPGFRVVVLYPDGGVSPRQAHGLACWGASVLALRVRGSFDACQAQVRRVLADPDLRAHRPLVSANSISLGRLLPQAAYYAHTAAVFHARHARPLGFIVPTGNLGNASAAWLARRMGAPVGDIHLACNANDTLPRFFQGDAYVPQPSRATLANAMDVGAPSNFERLRHWAGGDAPLRDEMTASSVDDDTIRATIAHAQVRHGVTPCPHTATGLHVLEGLRAAGDDRPWAVVATAHPAKFAHILTPLLGRDLPLPPALAACLARPTRAGWLAPGDDALGRWLRQLPRHGLPHPAP